MCAYMRIFLYIYVFSPSQSDDQIELLVTFHIFNHNIISLRNFRVNSGENIFFNFHFLIVIIEKKKKSILIKMAIYRHFFSFSSSSSNFSRFLSGMFHVGNDNFIIFFIFYLCYVIGKK